jgi:hypothetical protein
MHFYIKSANLEASAELGRADGGGIRGILFSD